MQKTSHNPSQNSNMELFLDLMLLLDQAWLESLNSTWKTTAVQAVCDEGRVGSSCFHRLMESFVCGTARQVSTGAKHLPSSTLCKCTDIWSHEFKLGFQWKGPKWRNKICNVCRLLMPGTFILPKTNVGFTTKAENKANVSFSAARRWVLKRTTTITITSFSTNAGVGKKANKIRVQNQKEN